MSGIHRHSDFHSSSNVYPTSWFILFVLFLTGGETSVVPTCVWDPFSIWQIHSASLQNVHIPRIHAPRYWFPFNCFVQCINELPRTYRHPCSQISSWNESVYFCLSPLLEIVHDFYEIWTRDGSIPNQNSKVVTHLYIVLVLIHELHQSANFRLFFWHIIEIFLRILFLILFRRGLSFTPFLNFGARLIFPPCSGIPFLVMHPAFFPHTGLFDLLPSSFFSVRGFGLSGPLPLFDATYVLGADDAFFGFVFLLGEEDFFVGAYCTAHDCFFPIKCQTLSLFWAWDNWSCNSCSLPPTIANYLNSLWDTKWTRGAATLVIRGKRNPINPLPAPQFFFLCQGEF